MGELTDKYREGLLMMGAACAQWKNKGERFVEGVLFNNCYDQVVLFLAQEAPQTVWRPGFARTRWESVQWPTDPVTIWGCVAYRKGKKWGKRGKEKKTDKDNAKRGIKYKKGEWKK